MSGNPCIPLAAKTVKKVKKPLHIIIFIINIFFPGIGTIITAFMSDSFFCETLLVGLC